MNINPAIGKLAMMAIDEMISNGTNESLGFSFKIFDSKTSGAQPFARLHSHDFNWGADVKFYPLDDRNEALKNLKIFIGFRI